MRKIMLLTLRATPVAVVFLLFPLLSAAQSPPGAAVPLNQVRLDENTLRVHFIDIGGGLAALIEIPGGKHMLI